MGEPVHVGIKNRRDHVRVSVRLCICSPLMEKITKHTHIYESLKCQSFFSREKFKALGNILLIRDFSSWLQRPKET